MNDKILKENIKKSKFYIKDCECLLIVAGAGMGIDSGLPDYRGPNGLWNTWHPSKTYNMTYDKLSTHEMFKDNISLAWGFQAYLTRLYDELEPHNGYYNLLDIANKKFNSNYFVITSNVDSQFLKSGFDKDRLYEVHGTKRLWQCMDKKCNNNNMPWLMDINKLPNIDEETLLAVKPYPKCIHCDNYARPNVSFFGDYNFSEKITQVQSKRLYDWIELNKNNKMLIIEIGCGISQHSIRFTNKNNQYTMLSNEWKLPKSFMSEERTKMIRINPDNNNEEYGIINISLGANKGIKMLC